jgi:type II secretory pathway component PulF
VKATASAIRWSIPLFPPMVVHMIGVGEESGSLDFMLQKIADFYESRGRGRARDR